MRASRRGFTLLEIMIVVVMVIILAGMGFMVITRRTDKTLVDRAAHDFQARVAYARSLAENSGLRLGTAAFVTDVSCTSALPPLPTNTLAFSADPVTGTYTVPVRLEYNAVTDTMTAFCNTYVIATETRTQGRMVTPSGAFVVAFTSLGRVDPSFSTPPGAGAYMARVERIASATDGYGFRVLPSGILCRADLSTAVACHEDL